MKLDFRINCAKNGGGIWQLTENHNNIKLWTFYSWKNAIFWYRIFHRLESL